MNLGKVIDHNIIIEASANNGFFVIVGCCRLAYTDKNQLIADLDEFLNDPERVEKEYTRTCSMPDVAQDEAPRPSREV